MVAHAAQAGADGRGGAVLPVGSPAVLDSLDRPVRIHVATKGVGGRGPTRQRLFSVISSYGADPGKPGISPKPDSAMRGPMALTPANCQIGANIARS